MTICDRMCVVTRQSRVVVDLMNPMQFFVLRSGVTGREYGYPLAPATVAVLIAIRPSVLVRAAAGKQNPAAMDYRINIK